MTTLREAAQQALEALENCRIEYDYHGNPIDEENANLLKSIDTLRAALAAPEPEPVAYFDPQKREFYWARPTQIDAPTTVDVPPLPLYAAPPTAAPEPTHPGYVLGSHWLETAYSRICAGEAEAEVLRDCGWQRVADIDALLRDVEALWRDAERYRWMKQKVKRIPPSWDLVGWDAAIDAAMENKI